MTEDLDALDHIVDAASQAATDEAPTDEADIDGMQRPHGPRRPDGASRLSGLSVHEAQEAIATQLLAASADGRGDDESDATSPALDQDDDDREEAIDTASEADGDAAVDLVWTAAEAAEHLKMVEAILFASGEALSLADIAKRLPDGADVKALMETLTAQYDNRGVHLSKAGGRYRFVTDPSVAHVLTEERTQTRKLSRAAMETLAIIAYHQPCTRADIEDVRGVAVSKGSIDQLLEIGWVRLAGRRKDAPGRPVLYGTTRGFLEHFDLSGIGDLPGMADLKAAGLLDANLPPGFSIPTPRANDGEEDHTDEPDDGDPKEFVQDFHDDVSDDAPDDAPDDALCDAPNDEPGDPPSDVTDADSAQGHIDGIGFEDDEQNV